MYIAAAVLGVILALVSLAAGAPKALLKGEVSAWLQSRMGLSAGFVRFIGLAEVVATVGLVVGLFWQPLGIAAAVGMPSRWSVRSSSMPGRGTMPTPRTGWSAASESVAKSAGGPARQDVPSGRHRADLP
ncbi:DoxX family protein [Streptomyces scopuliridis]|uniref:DoxX family protein n=1 Tax=Streptomyces scopuliridis TaxID=452529 RepID=UPI003684840C